jgi:hypothetical protein
LEVEYELTREDLCAFQWRGVFESARGRRARRTVYGVDSIEQSPDYIFIYTTPSAAHIIPKRAFRDPQAADAFYQFSGARMP